MKTMKKTMLFLMAVACISVASAQIEVGVQGGYFTQKASNSENKQYNSATNWLAGIQVGYKIKKCLYVGVSASYLSNATENMKDFDSLFHPAAPFPNNMNPVIDHKQRYTRTGWEVCPTVEYEFVRFGNMHFSLQLQGTIRSLGSTTFKESYTTLLTPNPLELVDEEPKDDHRTSFMWGVSLKPTLSYEFTPHISLEVILDFLSIGYISITETVDPKQEGVEPSKDYNSTFYAGANTFTEVLQWESPLLKIGMKYTF